jgi:hypothetical protein
MKGPTLLTGRKRGMSILDPTLQPDVADKLLAQGFHPSDVRQHFARKGISWRYEFGKHNGKRERRRRMVKGKLCANQCGGHAEPMNGEPGLCSSCLMQKFAEHTQRVDAELGR